ncbi:MAG TPA: hypothetical protein PLX23_09570, partial [Candidatus Hydrogenedens sp.]|nr:hypothetical protein [Candidatus Hydrogenedens sp.]
MDTNKNELYCFAKRYIFILIVAILFPLSPGYPQDSGQTTVSSTPQPISEQNVLDMPKELIEPSNPLKENDFEGLYKAASD